MKNYSVKEVAQLSGISVRTLHYYDQIGLLKPYKRTEAGYRHYGHRELLRLQQILFYKELDFPLKEIVAFLEEPEFHLIEALEDHKTALLARQKRIDHLVETIEKTIRQLKEDDIITKPEMLYEGLAKEMGTTYRQAAIKAYGKEKITHSESELMKLGKEGFKQLRARWTAINDELFERREESPISPAIQALIARHYQLIRQFWGTVNSSDKQAEAYAGLGTLYTQDERYCLRDGQAQPKFATFLQKAMRHFVDYHL
ncbi:MAG: MerR family transcriptional regulator [Saprospiraceae bacterium]|nr:MerR family transcriptional regulator [Saprospiraceae bacterium]